MTEALKRGLFGFTAESVRSVLAEREEMFRHVAQDARAAEARADEITARLETAQSERDSARAALTERERILEELTARAIRMEADIESVGAEVREHAEKARAANADTVSVRTELATVRRHLGEREAEIADLEAEIDRLRKELAAERPAADVAFAATSATTSDDLVRILRETESTMSRMVAEARWNAENELTEVVRRRDEVRAEIDGLTAWRDRIAPLAQGVRDLFGEAQARTAEVDERLRAALEPITTTMGSLHSRLIELVEDADMGDITSRGSVEEDELGTSETPPTAVIVVEEDASIARQSPW